MRYCHLDYFLTIALWVTVFSSISKKKSWRILSKMVPFPKEYLMSTFYPWQNCLTSTFWRLLDTDKQTNRQPKYIQRYSHPKIFSNLEKGHVKTKNLNFEKCKITLSASVTQSFCTYSMLGEESSIFK